MFFGETLCAGVSLADLRGKVELELVESLNFWSHALEMTIILLLFLLPEHIGYKDGTALSGQSKKF